jgi:hypothetical protein
MSPDGRVVIPARMRQALDRLQDEAAVLLAGLPSLSDALLADRRAEVEGS